MKSALLYGIALGLLLVAMQFFRYRLLVYDHSTEAYVGLVALLFTLLGAWAGRKFFRSKKEEKPAADETAPVLPVQTNAQLVQQLGITPRELEVLQLIAQGLSNREIAEQLYVSLNTVKTHAANVFVKLDVQRRTQAIQKAKTLGLLA
ncbi:MAG TPA: response regulator transcription factor [Saprospiraceae bacterium]|nr:response regulator transcription factor [Saprospiraceae bacterium]